VRAFQAYRSSSDRTTPFSPFDPWLVSCTCFHLDTACLELLFGRMNEWSLITPSRMRMVPSPLTDKGGEGGHGGKGAQSTLDALTIRRSAASSRAEAELPSRPSSSA
jgi:hypothetical protein